MDFLDSLDLDVSNKRSRRVRSWYLYEQFKSLERNQTDAAQRLKDRTFQDRLLRQELSERKERRKLFDQFSTSHSECRIERSVKSEGATTALSADDFYESYNNNLNDLTTASDRLSVSTDDFKTTDDKDDESNADSVNSVVNIKSEETITGDSEKDVDVQKHDVVDEINQYFDEITNNLEYIEKMTDVKDDNVLEDNSLLCIEEVDRPPAVLKEKNVNNCDNNVLAMWTKLVSFAYQIMQLNHGNCYYDYGSQFLTAVLACDVLRRGINTMCHILQPYVCPIKFATDSPSDIQTQNHVLDKISSSKDGLIDNKLQKNFTNQTRKFHSENFQHSSGYSTENRSNERKDRRASEPWRSTHKFSHNKGNPSKSEKASCSSVWPDFSNDDSTERFFRESIKCRCLNPVLKLSQYFDSVLKEIDDSLLL